VRRSTRYFFYFFDYGSYSYNAEQKMNDQEKFKSLNPIRHSQIPQRYTLDTDGKAGETLQGISDVLQITQELRKTQIAVVGPVAKTTTGDFSILSVTQGNLFITGLMFDYMCDAANTGTTQNFYYYPESGGQTLPLVRFVKLASVAIQKSVYIQFENPILIKKGGSIRGDFTFAAGTQTVGYTIYGYYE